MTATPPAPAHRGELSREESLALLAGVPVGRVAFSLHALPAIRLVSHIVLDGCVVFRAHEGACVVGRVSVTGVVAYEADELDPVTGTGWSVGVTGTATLVRDPAQLARYRTLLPLWIDGAVDGARDEVVRISPDIVTGYRLVRTFAS
ncbi:pyridoxamine 5'-phosphate oxidase family protein [Streptomyces inhibens]|uniref:pyridoxamine 5'-phosphate oxidase family protein n=1 Tax=Streptomyces inhibens TaxID=2293571 RepID=UPI001EE6DF9C|nr:pyridoxamine 5'-phosphate oxidase family protein [Streptomyces inhibens]UKY48543.1 pyridoxamine 5'-phosphate oxidase family protein [Streptomyces inhibens]